MTSEADSKRVAAPDQRAADHAINDVANQLAIIYQPEFVSDSDELFQSLASQVVWDERLRSRKTACFGQPYNYSGMVYAAAPMHQLLIPLVNRLASSFA